MEKLDEVRALLLSRVAEATEPRSVLRSAELRELYGVIATLSVEERGAFGKKVNELKQELERAITAREDELSKVDLPPIDVTALMDVNAVRPSLLPSEQGTIHPLSAEIERQLEIGRASCRERV